MSHISWIEERLKGKGPPLVIDGGMGTLLQKSGVPMDGRVWSGRPVLTHPDAICRALEVFISAGADVIITYTFTTGRHMLEPAGLGDQVVEINKKAVVLARQARDRAVTHPVAVAGSICEWAPSEDTRWGRPESIGRSVREQSGPLAEAGVDLIALEMCEHTPYSVAAIEAALETGLPVWVGVSARTQEGRDALSVFDYAELDFDGLARDLSGFPVMMMNVMHTPLQDVDKAVDILKRYWNDPIGIYPEAGYFKMPDWHFVDIIEPDDLVALARAWVDGGVRMIGGCCGLGPEHIAALRAL